MEQILERLDHLEELLIKQASGPLTLAEAARFLGLSKPHLYKLTHQKKLPCSRPGGKKLYFDPEELKAWAMSHRVKTDTDIDEAADRILDRSRRDS